MSDLTNALITLFAIYCFGIAAVAVIVVGAVYFRDLVADMEALDGTEDDDGI